MTDILLSDEWAYARQGDDIGGSERAPGSSLRLPEGLRIWKPGDLSGSEPQLGDAAWHGPIGDLLAIVEPHTEATVEAIGAGVIVLVGTMLGRDVVYTPRPAISQRPNEFVAIVGPTGLGRKSTAEREAIGFARGIDPMFTAGNFAGGFGSGESAIDLIRDPEYDDDGKVIGGRTDQRLVIFEDELARVLTICHRPESILSSVLRAAFDGHRLEHRTKRGGHITASKPHVSVFGSITASEFVELMDSASIASGLGNRFLTIWSRSKRSLPFGGDDTTRDVNRIAETIRSSMPGRRGPVQYTFADDAGELWADAYVDLSNPTGPEIIRALLGRQTVHTIRISMIYAALDGASQIGRFHLEAALAWTEYSAHTIRLIFGGYATTGTANRILEVLRAAPGKPVNRSSLYGAFGGRNRPHQNEIDAAVDELASAGLAYRFQGETGEQGGRPAKLLIATIREPQ